MRAGLGTMIALSALGCADASVGGRSSWLQGVVVEDNRVWFERDPDRAVEKMHKMASAPYRWFRGTAAVFVRDAARPGPGGAPTAYGTGASSQVLAIGDPHVENLGSFKHADGHLSIEFNDFDGAGHGPYHLDVRRLALGFWIAGHQIGLPDDARDAVARATVEGYVAEIEDELAGRAPVDVRRGAGALVDDLIRRAERDGDAGEALAEYTVLDEATGRRAMVLGEVEAPTAPGFVADEMVGVTTAERSLVEAVLAAYPESLMAAYAPSVFALKGVARRLGAGVASYPVPRFYALLEGPTSDPADDWLVEIKALPGQIYPPAVSGPWPTRPFEDDGARAVLIQRTWQSTNTADPLLGWATVPPMSFRVRHRTKYQKGISVDRMAEKLAEGTWAPADIEAFAALAGRLLARGHARSRTLRGDDGLQVVAEALRGDGAGFVDETMAFLVGAEGYGPRTLADHALFRAILAADSMLGYRPARDQTGLPTLPAELRR